MPIILPSLDNWELIAGDGYVEPINFIQTVQNIVFLGDLVKEINGSPFAAYLYAQYYPDPHLRALVKAYNRCLQEYLNYFNTLNLPVYAGNAMIVGTLLDWVGEGIYGIPRPTLPAPVTLSDGEFNTDPFNNEAFNTFIPETIGTPPIVDDDAYKRILTWILYRGDGQAMTIEWIARRIVRFLTGVNGLDGMNAADAQLENSFTGVDSTNMVSVTFGPAPYVINLSADVAGTPYESMWALLKSAIDAGIIPLPAGYTYNVT